MLKRIYLYTLICLLSGSQMVTAQTISTVAGTGYLGYSGDGAQATNARIAQPYGLAVDSSGNLFIADGSNNRVRKVNASGVITTWAGNGVGSWGGWTGGSATSFGLSPCSVVVDKSQNLLICVGNSVLKVTPAQWLTFVGGYSVSGGYGGDGAAFSSTSAGIAAQGIALDKDGNLYLADANNNRIRKVDTLAGGFGNIHTIAGNGTAGSLGDGGLATSAELHLPYDVCVDKFGNVYFTDYSNNKIRKVTLAGIISTYAGTGTAGYMGDGGPATNAQINSPFGIDCDTAGNIFFSDSHNNVIRKISTSGIISTIAGTGTAGFGGDGGPATAAVMNDPFALALDRYGNIYFTDGQNFRVRKITYCNPPAAATITGPAAVCATGSISLSPSASGGTWYASNGHASVAGGTVTGISAGIDTIYYVYTTCAAVVTSKIVTVNAAPAAITGSSAVCSGGLITLTDATTGGTWTSGSSSVASISSAGVIIGGAAGTVSIDYTLPSTGCFASFVLTVEPAPAAITGTPELCAGSTFSLSTASTGGSWTSNDPSIATVSSAGVVNGIVTGTVLISYTLSTGCARTVVATIDPLPAAITGLPLVCTGMAAMLADASPGGMWSSSNTSVATVSSGSVTGVAAGAANITYMLVTGCKATIVATVNTSPAAITGALDICTGGTITLADATTGGSWSSSNPALASIDNAAGVVTGLTGGLATIAYAIVNGCTATVSITVKDCLGVTAASSPQPRIYPNPANDHLTIEAPFIINTVTITDVTGRVLYNTGNNAVEIAIPVAALKPGFYVVSINGGYKWRFMKD